MKLISSSGERKSIDKKGPLLLMLLLLVVSRLDRDVVEITERFEDGLDDVGVGRSMLL